MTEEHIIETIDIGDDDYTDYMPGEQFRELVKTDWLEAFAEYGRHGECSPRLIYWCGVSTVGAALQRKVYYQHGRSQWSPNFYILIVAEQAVARKSTAINTGMELFRDMEGVVLGPDCCTWQAFLEMMGRNVQGEDEKMGATVMLKWPDDGSCHANQNYVMASVTLPISELGTFFRADNFELRDLLTDLWDGTDRVWKRLTKTAGDDIIPKPWINFIAGTTPAWVASNFSPEFLETGLASRFIFLYGERMYRRVAYPPALPQWYIDMGTALSARLKEMVDLMCIVQITKEAKQWGKKWYDKLCDAQIAAEGTLDIGFLSRKQCHLHKLGIIIAASRNHLPQLRLSDLQEADRRLKTLDHDTSKTLQGIGHTKITAATMQIVAAVKKEGFIERRKLFAQRFMHTLSDTDFKEAVRGAIQAELIYEVDAEVNPILAIREVAEKEKS